MTRNSTRELAHSQEHLGLLHYLRGDFARARKYYEQVLNDPQPTASAAAQTLRMLTDVYIAEGQVQEGSIYREEG